MSIGSATLLLLLQLSACRDDKPPILEPEPVVHTLVRVAGDSLSDTVAHQLGRLTVRAEDKAGNPMRDVSVRFFVPVGSNGMLDTSLVRTDANGLATSQTWTLGTRSGVQVARAHAQEVATVFTAFALPDRAVVLEEFAGDKQVTSAGSAVRVSPAVRVTDKFGNGVADVPVTFAPQASSITGTQTRTDSTGVAFALEWTPLAGATTMLLSAHSESVPDVDVVFEARVVPVLFNVEFRVVAGVAPARLRLALERAAARWVAVLSGHSGVSTVVMAAGECVSSSPALNEPVTDLLVLIRVGSIDGRGGALASASPCAYHEETGLPVVSVINFDSNDIAEYSDNEWIDLIATHEFGHALGFGTFWLRRGLLAGGGTPNPLFTGTAARREYDAAFGANDSPGVPLENTGGPGTADRHWRASIFVAETMNGFVGSRVAPLSRITIASMEDVGYAVDYLGADEYPSAQLALSPGVQLLHEQIPAPRTMRVMPMKRSVRR